MTARNKAYLRRQKALRQFFNFTDLRSMLTAGLALFLLLPCETKLVLHTKIISTLKNAPTLCSYPKLIQLEGHQWFR